MIEIYPNLYVGDQNDEIRIRGQPAWFVVHACKIPYHPEALGYTSNGAPKEHPEYFLAHRPGRLILNIIDVPKVSFISPIIINAALETIHQNINTLKVLVHCNQGLSRSPSIALLYLLRHTNALGSHDYAAALTSFQSLYPPYNPGTGMADYVRLNWAKYLPAT